jgi:hypothetical protein
MTLEIRAYDHGRPDGFKAISARFLKVCQGLAGISPNLVDWMGDGGGVDIPVATPADADAIVGAAARMWRLGVEELAAYGPSAKCGASGRLALVGGMPKIELPAWIPNQMILTVDAAAEVELRSDPKLVARCLQLIVTAADPAWAVVASDDWPTAPVAPFDDGAPTVGWFTYLASSYPALPVALPDGATRHDVGTGTIVQAHGSRPDRAAIERLALALKQGGVLEPHVRQPASSGRPT